MCLIISFTGVHDINTHTFLFHSDDDIYILETIKTLTETNKCYYRGPLRSFGEQDGWMMDELGFNFPSTVFQSFRDNGRVNMKGSVQ